ncbi:MAG: hypothetical protein PHS56_02640 [Eubacteriales bacterium]|nr:hypothetical protein [Eubacteriales bacterium]MDD3073315.1 hypothetical protein [Eubacteriales bacterium]MDD4078536.1 hypothetical protein [Eubacteriales bacterium]MDD4768667.1 hypothetical protein [Eubacteriales bacterium]
MGKQKRILWLILSRPLIAAVILSFGTLGLLLSVGFFPVAAVVSGGRVAKWAQILAEMLKFAVMGL